MPPGLPLPCPGAGAAINSRKLLTACCTLLLRRYDEHSYGRFPPSSDNKPFTYVVVAGGRFVYASAIRLAVLKVVMSLSVSDFADTCDCFLFVWDLQADAFRGQGFERCNRCCGL